jgi:hypothetical protein
VQRALIAAGSKLQRNFALAVKHEAKQLATKAGAFNVERKKLLFFKPVHLEGLDLVTDAYGLGVYGCV